MAIASMMTGLVASLLTLDGGIGRYEVAYETAKKRCRSISHQSHASPTSLSFELAFLLEDLAKKSGTACSSQ
ncbi:hypothetical protein R6Q59_010323, partial [Mikania micrantha]